MIYPPTELAEPSRLMEIATSSPPGGEIRIQTQGESLEGDPVSMTVLLPLGPAGEGVARLAGAGLELRDEEGKVLIDNIAFGSHAEKAGLDFDWEITALEMDADRPSKQLMIIPALIVLGLLGLMQRSRRGKPTPGIARA